MSINFWPSILSHCPVLSVLVLVSCCLSKALDYVSKLDIVMLPGSQTSGFLFLCFSDSVRGLNLGLHAC